MVFFSKASSKRAHFRLPSAFKLRSVEIHRRLLMSWREVSRWVPQGWVYFYLLSVLPLWKQGDDALGTAERAEVILQSAVLTALAKGSPASRQSLRRERVVWHIQEVQWTVRTPGWHRAAISPASQDGKRKETRALQAMAEQCWVWRWVTGWRHEP